MHGHVREGVYVCVHKRVTHVHVRACVLHMLYTQMCDVHVQVHV